MGGWFLPTQAPVCPSSSPPQFSSGGGGGGGGHSSGSYCERYSSLRSHRASPYPSHYPHRSSSTSKTPLHPPTPPDWEHWCSRSAPSSDTYMDTSSPALQAHDGWSALQIPNSSGMGSNSASNSR